MASWCGSPSRPARTKSRTRKDCWRLSVSNRRPLPRLPVRRRPRDTLQGGEDATLRPARLADYVGQRRLTEERGVHREAARRRSEALDHVLLYGLPGLGQPTLAHIIAAELGVGIRVTSGPAIEKPGDLAAILTNALEEGDVLFIDEIHRLGRVAEEHLYPAMEDYKIDIVLGQGPAGRTTRLNLPS